MKNLKKYPEIFAQQIILNGMMEIIEVLEPTLAKIKGTLIEDYKINLSTYNDGYQVNTNLKISYENYLNANEEEKQLFNSLSSFPRLYLYPNSFFGKYINSKEGSGMTGDLGLGKNSSDTYFNPKVKGLVEMKNEVDKFVSEVIKRLNTL